MFYKYHVIMFSGMEAVGGGLFHLFIIDPIGQKRCHFERFGSHNHINADKSLGKLSPKSPSNENTSGVLGNPLEIDSGGYCGCGYCGCGYCGFWVLWVWVSNWGEVASALQLTLAEPF